MRSVAKSHNKLFILSETEESSLRQCDQKCFGKATTKMFQKSPGTDVMIFKIFSPKNSAKKLAFLTQNKAN
jgi:hypothetical protein